MERILQTQSVLTDATEVTDHWWWRPGWQVGTRYYAWHVTFEDQPMLRDLLAPHQKALRPFNALDVIPGQWLHMTMHGVGHVAEVSDRERADVVAAVRHQVAALDPVPLTFHGPVIGREAVVLDPTDPVPMRRVHRAVAAGTAQGIAAPDTSGDDTYWPHVSLAYANTTCGTQEIRAALDAVKVEPLTTTVRQITLIEMHRDHRMYQWRTIEQVRLGSV